MPHRIGTETFYSTTTKRQALLADNRGTGRNLTPPQTPSPRLSGERGFEFRNHCPPHPSPPLCVEGNGIIARRGAGFRIGAKGSVVDNNGIHAMTEKSGAIYLKAGRHPIRVDWFNGGENCI